MPTRLVAVPFDAREPTAGVRFSAELLGREVVDEDDGVPLPWDPRRVGLCLVAASTDDVGLTRLRLHLTSAGPEAQRATVEKALSIGGRHLNVGQLPKRARRAERSGDNEFCVIESGNGFLAGCGPLGRGRLRRLSNGRVFWHKVLEWPLVWNQYRRLRSNRRPGAPNWRGAGPAVAPKQGRNRQRFELVAADL